MLEQFFTDPVAVERLRGGPLGPYLQSFASSLAKLGYATSTARSQIEFLDDVGEWLLKNGIAVADMDERVLEVFLDERRRQGGLHRGQASTVWSFMGHLRSVAAVPSYEAEIRETPLDLLERRYERFLRTERGLARATVVNYVPFVHRFLVGRFGSDHLSLRELRPSDVSSFILQYAHSMSPGRAKLMTTAVRSFLRFLLRYGEIESTGRRDYAILLLLARLGLRAGEVVALQLDDIEWRAGEMTVRGKGHFHDRMPLPTDVGQALAAYLRQDRPRCESRRAFIRMKAPRRGFANPSTVSTIVRRALQRAGLQPPIKGAHLLRHTLATGMLREGGSLTEIGQILRHRASSTTEIYARVDLEGLRSLSLPWPGNGGGR
jgi:site-specific recombinase XerD